MGVKLMNAVYDSDLTDVYDVAVLLCLASHADDSGSCYPSMARIAKRTRMKERGVRNVVRRLTEQGYLEVKIGGGRGGSNTYFVYTNPAHNAEFMDRKTRHPIPPAPDAPRHPMPETRYSTTVNPAPHAAEQSRTTINHQIDDDGAREKKSEPTHRENLLAAMGVGPDGITGPSAKMIGRATDMAEVEKWDALGISRADQCTIVAETMRSKPDGQPPSKFLYFSGPMADFAAAKIKPMPVARQGGKPSGRSQIDRWDEITQRHAGGRA